MTRWLRRVGALFVALGALFAALSYRKHSGRALERSVRADDLEREKGVSAAEARVAHELAIESALKAEAALAKGRANIELIKERTDATFADRLDAVNRRLRGN